MKVKLIKRSADNKVIVELEDKVGPKEFGATALRRLEREANYFLTDRQDRIRGKKSFGSGVPTPQFRGTTSSVASGSTVTSRPVTTVPTVTAPRADLVSLSKSARLKESTQ